MKPVAPTVEPRDAGVVLGSSPDLASSIYILSELISLKDQMGVCIGDGDYDWSRRLVLCLREAYERGEFLCGAVLAWCDPKFSKYREFNERWDRLGQPVNSPASHV